MKLASCVLLPDSNVRLLAYRGATLADTLGDIASIGYDGVELFVRDAREVDRRELERLLAQNGLEVCAVGTSPINAQDKLTLASPDADVRRAAFERAQGHIDFAAGFGSIPVCIGKFRGNLPPEMRTSGWKWMREGFEALCDYAAAKNVLIALEPQARSNLNNINSTRDGVVWVEQIGAENLGLLLDSYHMHLEDASLAEGVIEAHRCLTHVHVSDSNRGAPGSGNLNFTAFIRALQAVGYGGWLSLEIEQPANAFLAARQAWAHLSANTSMYAKR